MKKIILLTVLFCVVFLPAFAEKSQSFLQLDAGAGLSMGLYNQAKIDAAYPNEETSGYAAAYTLTSFRGGFYGSVRVCPINLVSVGAEFGAYTLKIDDQAVALDFPVRAIVRFGKGNTFIQGFGGYYLSVGYPVYGGLEIGAKASLGGLYFLTAYTDNGNFDFMRYELGYSLNDLLSR